MRPLAYEVRDLTKIYPKAERPANDRLTLSVFQGEVFGLLGPNGAGKTTLVRQLAGLARPTSGSISLFGQDLVRHPELASHWIALQPQGNALPKSDTVLTLMQVTGQLRGLTRAEAGRQTEALLARFHLEPHQHKRFVTLSGGLRRLVERLPALFKVTTYAFPPGEAILALNAAFAGEFDGRFWMSLPLLTAWLILCATVGLRAIDWRDR